MEDMALVYNINLCRICQIPSNLNLFDTSTIAENGNSYLNMFKNVFGDIIWIEDQFMSLVCQTCIFKMSEIAEFKKICLETNNRREFVVINCIKREVEDELQDDDVKICEDEDFMDDSWNIGAGRIRKVETDSLNVKQRKSCDEVSQGQFDDEMKIDIIEDVDGFFQLCGEEYLKNDNELESKEENRSIETSQEEKSSKSSLNNRKKMLNKTEQHQTTSGGILCDICDLDCITRAKLDRHMFSQHKDARSYICSICGRGYITKDDLSRHLKIVHNNKEQKHKEVRHNIKENCTVLRVELNNDTLKCSIIADEQNQNDQKASEINIEGQRKELKRAKQFAKAKTKNKDVGVQTKSRSKTGRTRTLGILCHICRITCISLADRDRHIYSQHNGTRTHICAICGRGYITKDDLSGHLKAVHSDKEQYKFLCTECGAKFYKLSVLHKHTESRHINSRKFACTLCDNKFTTNGNLKSHMLTHTNVRQFKCDLCPAEYKRKDIYLIHMTQKHGIGNYKCNRNLKDKNHACSMCDQRFNTRPRLLVHIRKHHTDVEPFSSGVK